jgi:hypothetical protein
MHRKRSEASNLEARPIRCFPWSVTSHDDIPGARSDVSRIDTASLHSQTTAAADARYARSAVSPQIDPAVLSHRRRRPISYRHRARVFRPNKSGCLGTTAAADARYARSAVSPQIDPAVLSHRRRRPISYRYRARVFRPNKSGCLWRRLSGAGCVVERRRREKRRNAAPERSGTHAITMVPQAIQWFDDVAVNSRA